MLAHDDWLPLAKRLAVGQRIKVFHKNENRPNMTVGNERGHWWAYCQRCKEGGRLDKEHVLLAPGGGLEEPQSLELPRDLRQVLGSDYEAAIGRFLASKGMDMCMLPKLWYSEDTRRLCLQDPGGSGWHGRDLTGRSAAKWLHYSKPALAGVVGRTVVVTEDLFSMFKVMYAMNSAYNTDPGHTLNGAGWVSTLGAGCGVRAALALSPARRIVWAYDGDKAGDDGFVQAAKRMRVHGSKQYRARPPEGKDPKDMTVQEIRDMIEGALCGSK